MTNPLLQLVEAGQSYWLDNLTRGMIESGELKTRVAEEGLRGVTSNPNIFNKAIGKSSDYDAQIRELSRAELPIEAIYERLAIEDVRSACDILRPVFEESEGADGFVSLEVSPHLAHDPEATLKEAKRLFREVDRPNVFIKIPGTQAGLSAIEESLAEGVPINITLLFSVARYEAVANAYLRALERRLEQGLGLRRVASVASFFLSRIDTLVDQLLGHRRRVSGKPDPQSLLGKTAVANAKMAYQSFKKIFSGERWNRLERQGARVQRPLWASTSTKNPRYSDVLYVEPLIGPNTVNTMPEETIAAFRDHGKVTKNSVEKDLEGARRTLGDLAELGIDLGCVTWQLENEGIQKFIEPYDELLKSLEAKRAAL